MRLRGLALWLAVAVSGAALIGWNAARFRGVDVKPRTKDLDFLPSPEVARALAMGHDSTVAVLRWIDSFAFFELQLDKRDDAIAGTATGGFQRLYDMLIGLDPKFEPFYEHAALCTSGLLKQDRLALGYLLRGTLELPHDTALWRNAASMLYANFQLGERRPEQFDGFLTAWEDQELDADDRLAIRIWKENLGKRKFAHLEQLPYWFDRLNGTAPGTPMGDYVEGVVREQLARYAVAELQALADLVKATGFAPTRIEQLAEPSVVVSRYGRQGPPEFAPLLPMAQRIVVLSDPWGYDYQIVDGAVRSPGLETTRFDLRVGNANNALDARRRAGKDAPRSIDELSTLGIELPTPPAGGELSIADGRIVVRYAPPPHAPYPVRQFAAADAREQKDALRSALAAPHR